MVWNHVKPFAIILPYKEIYKAGAVYFNRPAYDMVSHKAVCYNLAVQRNIQSGCCLF